MKTLIVVSGGDAPGINAAIWRFVRLAERNDNSVVGADGGFPGAIESPYRTLTSREIAPLVALAGSLLASSRQAALATAEGRDALKARLHQEGIDNLLLFGGDGTLRHIPPHLSKLGIPCVAIPTTIDNDVTGTELTLGFDSACNYAYQAVDGALATGYALPGRIFALETLGGGCGNLALAVAHGSGAHVVLVPEVPYTDDWLKTKVMAALERDRFAFVVHSEGIPDARMLPQRLEALTGTRVRDIRLGHAQRGARPTHQDRTLAVDMATTAYNALSGGKTMGTVIFRGGAVDLHHGLLSELQASAFNNALYERINA